MSLIRKHGAVLQAWACLDLVLHVLIRHPFCALVFGGPPDGNLVCKMSTGLFDRTF